MLKSGVIPGPHIHITSSPAVKSMPAASPQCAQHMNRELLTLCPRRRSAPAAAQPQPWVSRRESTLSTTAVGSSAYCKMPNTDTKLQTQSKANMHQEKHISAPSVISIDATHAYPGEIIIIVCKHTSVSPTLPKTPPIQDF